MSSANELPCVNVCHDDVNCSHLPESERCPNCLSREVETVERAYAATYGEWNYSPEPDGEPFTDKDGNEVLGFHDRIDGQDVDALCAAFEANEGRPIQLRPILVRTASEIECRINGWEEGTFVRCTERAKNPQPMWQVEVAEESSGEEGS